MAKKSKVLLPSLTESTKGKVVAFPLIAKLDNKSIDLLEHHGYDVQRNVTVKSYKLLPNSIFHPYLLFVYLLLQDILHGQFFNKYRYTVYLMMLSSVYNVKLTEKQSEKLSKHTDEYSFATSHDGKPLSSDQEEQTTQEEVEQPIVKHIPKIILLSSDFAGVGKSTTANLLEKTLGEDDVLQFSFADEIRSQLAYIFAVSGIDPIETFRTENYNATKNNLHEYSEDYNPIHLRTLICDYSDVLQMHFGSDYWAKLAAKTIETENFKYYLIDDLRRNIELDYLKKQFGEENILTVYLTKKNADKPLLTGSTLGYEGQLNPAEFDIQFEFDETWSNTPELIKTITERL